MATVWDRVGDEVASFTPRALSGLGAILAFWVLGLAVNRLLVRVGRGRALDPDLTRIVARSAHLALFAFGIATSLGTLGVDVKALVAGLGLTGFALGFALRDIIANTLAGILILFYKPFRRGDRIAVAGSEGVIAEIDLRYTVLTVDAATRVLVPNSTLFTNSITVVDRERAAERGAPRP